MWLLWIVQRLRKVTYLMRHRGVPKRLKILPYLAFAYLIFPRDLLFDWRAFGMLDDFFVVTFLLGVFIVKAERHLLTYNQRRQDAIDADFKVLVEQEQAKARGEGPPPGGRSRAGAQQRREPGDTPKDDLRSHG